MPYSEPEVDAAIRAYFRHYRRQGVEDCHISQPSNSSDVYSDRVVLTNCRGYLATYDLKTRKVRGGDGDRILVEGHDEADEAHEA